jgi:hypothetical protein
LDAEFYHYLTFRKMSVDFPLLEGTTDIYMGWEQVAARSWPYFRLMGQVIALLSMLSFLMDGERLTLGFLMYLLILLVGQANRGIRYIVVALLTHNHPIATMGL